MIGTVATADDTGENRSMSGNSPSRFAREYARLVPLMDARGAADHRTELVAGLAGTVIEVGAGTGANFRHYEPAVASVLAVEPDEYLRDQATQSALTARARITVIAGVAESLPSADSSADAVVCSLVMCSVENQAAALAEIRRVLRPGGQLRFYEHVRSHSRTIGLLQDVVTPLWARAAGGCHPNRDTVASIRAAGFAVDGVRRFGFAGAPIAPRLSHVIGRAWAPA
jgi:ubiquinone/menaquinone biosynthesis C-methylase UbiE